MEKIKITINKITRKEIEYNDVKFVTDNYVSIENYEILLNDIMSTIILNTEIEDKISNIQIRFAKGIMDLLTNIDTSELKADDFFASDIINILKENICNYSICLDNILKEYQVYQNKNGFGLIASKVPSEDGMKNVIDNISNMVKEMDPEKIQTLLKGIAFDKMPLANFINNASKKDKPVEKAEVEE